MLRRLGPQFPPSEHPQLLVGLDRPDDAAVYALDDERALVQTLDFFAPVVDDPWQFGAVAAANAMSDVYAMGGRVLFALNIAAFPEDLPPDVIAEILRGGADKVREAGAVIAGGHTIIDEEPKYGLAVTGEVARDRIRTNGGARPGDQIVLTKPVGTGVLIGARQQGAVTDAAWTAAIDQMTTLNRAAIEAVDAVDGERGGGDLLIHAVADVTGFGLAGHLHEMASLAGVEIEIALQSGLAMEGLREAVEAGFGSGGQGRNREFYLPHIRRRSQPELSTFEEAMLFDPQTSGGLLIAVDDAAVESLLDALAERGVWARVVGNVGNATGEAEGGGLTLSESGGDA